MKSLIEKGLGPLGHGEGLGAEIIKIKLKVFF